MAGVCVCVCVCEGLKSADVNKTEQLAGEGGGGGGEEGGGGGGVVWVWVGGGGCEGVKGAGVGGVRGGGRKGGGCRKTEGCVHMWARPCAGHPHVISHVEGYLSVC